MFTDECLRKKISRNENSLLASKSTDCCCRSSRERSNPE